MTTNVSQIVVAVASHFRSPEFRWFRTGLFIAMGLSAVFPIAHALIIYGVRHDRLCIVCHAKYYGVITSVFSFAVALMLRRYIIESYAVDGRHVYSRSSYLWSESTREMVSRYIRHMGK